MNNINWRWPETPENGLIPWWVILRKSPGFALYIAGISVAFAGCWIAYEKKDALDFWKRNGW